MTIHLNALCLSKFISFHTRSTIAMHEARSLKHYVNKVINVSCHLPSMSFHFKCYFIIYMLL